MFENFVNADAKPRYRSIWASVLLHGFAIVVFVLFRLIDAARFSFVPVVHADSVKLILPPPMDRLIVAEVHQRQPAKVEATFSEPVVRDEPLTPPSTADAEPTAPATVSADLLVPSETIDVGSFPIVQNLTALVPNHGLPDSVIAKPIEPVDVREQLPPSPPNVELPRLIVQVRPEYPEVARLARVSGVVRLQGIINAQGRVTDIQVVSGHPLLIDAAVACVEKWRYTPAQVNGHTIPTPVNVDVRFELKFH